MVKKVGLKDNLDMQDLVLFKKIDIDLPKDKVYSRLGYAKGKTKLTPKQEEIIDDYIKQAKSLIELKGVARKFFLKNFTKDKIILDNNIIFNSQSLAKMLVGCKEVLLLAATLGVDIIKTIKDNIKNKNITKAVVFDAVASETVDYGLTWLTNYLSYQFRRENKQFTSRRFSAGYGDFLLENQKFFYQLLELNKLGVKINKQYIFTPEKTVTAILGVK